MGKRDNLMLKLDELTSGLFNLKAGLSYQLFANKKLLKRNEALKVSGEEAAICFILGNGPSLKNVDLKLIEKFPCFTVNLFYKSGIDFKTSYHVFADHGFNSDEYFKYVKEIYDEHPETKIIVRDSLLDRVKAGNMYDERVYFIRPDYVQRGNKVQCDMQHCMTGSINVIPIVIACAVDMGYKKICLLGCDFNSYAVAKNEHFYDAKNYEERTLRGDIVGDLIRCALVHKQHYALDYCSQMQGCKIYNLTEGSLIDAYERDTLENVLQQY